MANRTYLQTQGEGLRYEKKKMDSHKILQRQCPFMAAKLFCSFYKLRDFICFRLWIFEYRIHYTSHIYVYQLYRMYQLDQSFEEWSITWVKEERNIQRTAQRIDNMFRLSCSRHQVYTVNYKRSYRVSAYIRDPITFTIYRTRANGNKYESTKPHNQLYSTFSPVAAL